MSVFLQPGRSAGDLTSSARHELERTLEAVDRLRDWAITNLSEDHPCTLEIEDFAWYAKRFAEGIIKQLRDECP